MTTWMDRVDPYIRFKTPSELEFFALWKGDKRSKEKKLGVFQYPNARGAVVQDLDVSEEKYPLTFYFEGPNHDLDAESFWRACDERGTWLVTHPVSGSKILQLVSVTQAVEPINSGNITEFDTEWIEVGIDNPSKSTGQLEAVIWEMADDVADAAAKQAAWLMKNDTGLRASIKKLLARMEKLKKSVMGISSAISEVRQGVLEMLDSTVATTAGLAGAVTSLITTPALIINDLGARFDYYNKVLTDAFTTSDSTVSVNDAAVRELTVTAALTGMAVTLSEADITSRESALGYLDRLQASYLRGINGLDAMQDRFADAPVDKQYFSQSQSYLELVDLMSMTRDLLLRRAFDLAVAKHITLDRYRSPVEIALTEGVDLDSFITANNLHADEILLLPPGRQVVIYL